jgi:hypothetical protein
MIEEMNQLEKWHEDGIIILVWSETAQREALNNRNGLLRRKADTHIYTISDESPEDEVNINKRRIFELMDINESSSVSDVNDAKIVYEAYKYQAILITADGGSKSQPQGILGRRDKLRNFVKIVKPIEAVQIVRNAGLGI